MNNAIIKIENVSFAYPGKPNNILNDISFQLESGEWLALVGHNGSGKSTLAKLLIGLIEASEGSICVDNMRIEPATIWDIRKKIGIVFQNPDNQFVGTTVEDDVAFGLENLGIEREEMVKRVQDAIKKVGMEKYLRHEPHQLSGGQKQRVAIAGVVAQQPDIIILDEATSMLDPKGKREIQTIIRNLKEEKNMSIISITHDLEEAANADRMIVLNRGRILAEGKPDEIFSKQDLKDTGLDLPFSLKVQMEMKKAGIEIDPRLYKEQDMEGLAELLCKSLSKM